MNERKVPGLWMCPKCSCSLGQFRFNAITGQVGAKINEQPPTCPNNCGPMQAVTEPVQ